jgi:hypothetical protein
MRSNLQFGSVSGLTRQSLESQIRPPGLPGRHGRVAILASETWPTLPVTHVGGGLADLWERAGHDVTRLGQWWRRR